MKGKSANRNHYKLRDRPHPKKEVSDFYTETRRPADFTIESDRRVLFNSINYYELKASCTEKE